MENVNRWSLLFSAVVLFACLFFLHGVDGAPVRREPRSVAGGGYEDDIHITMFENQVVINNSLIELTFSNPGGNVIGIKYKGIDNVLEIRNPEKNRGYWDLVWGTPYNGGLDSLQGTQFNVVTASPDQVEISFTKTYDVSLGDVTLPLNVDKRYIMQRGRAGFYAYAIFERLEGWPEVHIDEIRIAFKLRQDKFQFMAIADDRKRVMPTAKDRESGTRLAYAEAVLLTNPSNPDLRGEVDDKYQYTSENKDNKLHGWISTNDPQLVGFWIITPSNEFRADGPFKQDLTSHVGPTAISTFMSGHYVGNDVRLYFKDGEPWKKVFGPVFIYLNSFSEANSNDSVVHALWDNAKDQLVEEVNRWPYNFTQSEDFPNADQRGSVFGQLRIRDRYLNRGIGWAHNAYVGLAPPGDAGSWQTERKGYQFWTKADKNGYFFIKDVRPGNYSLYATVPGYIGDYKYEAKYIIVEPGAEINLRNLVYGPPRNGPTLWEIGIPDRSAAEFYIPDPCPTLVNKLYINQSAHKFRQYGLWDRYSDLYPDHDLVYNVSADNYWDDWFFAHVLRNKGNNTYAPTTWQILFQLKSVTNSGNYTFQLALASATYAEVQVRFNDGSANRPHFTTGLIGKDNAIARHGIHGLYWLFSVNVPSHLLQEGNNIVYLTQSRRAGTFTGVMYDYIRLEGPPHK